MAIALILDGNSLYARSYFASKSGFQAGKFPEVQIGLRMLSRLVSHDSSAFDRTPTHLLVCYDGMISKTDKQRALKPQDYMDGLEELKKRIAEVFGGAQFNSPGEADDAVATAVFNLKSNPDFEEIFVVSGDTDLQALSGDRVSYYSLCDKCVVGFGQICRDWDIQHPSQVAIALAVIGDSADKIPGIYKFGTKKFKKLMAGVTAEMSLIQVAEHVASQLSDGQLAEFQSCLELTLLQTDVPEVPTPEPINFTELSFETDQFS